jgi:hypothetical protein
MSSLVIQQYRPPRAAADGARRREPPPSNPILDILTSVASFFGRAWVVGRMAMLALVMALGVRVLLNCSEEGTLTILGIFKELGSCLGLVSGVFSRVQSLFAFTEDNRNLVIFLSSFLATICVLACIFRS